jgi:hypothetical protein
MFRRVRENLAKVDRKNPEKKGKSEEKIFFLVTMPL